MFQLFFTSHYFIMKRLNNILGFIIKFDCIYSDINNNNAAYSSATKMTLDIHSTV